jgi:hypothetical protein
MTLLHISRRRKVVITSADVNAGKVDSGAPPDDPDEKCADSLTVIATI